MPKRAKQSSVSQPTATSSFKWTVEHRMNMANYVVANYETYKNLGEKGGKKLDFLRKMRAECSIECTDQQLRNGFKTFMDKYSEIRQKLNSSGFGVDPEIDSTIDYGWVKRECPYFEVLDTVLGTRPNVTPPCILGSTAIGNIGEPNLIEVDDPDWDIVDLLKENVIKPKPNAIPCPGQHNTEDKSNGAVENLIKNSFARIGVKPKDESTDLTPKSGIGAFTKLLREKTDTLGIVEEKKLKLDEEKFAFQKQVEEKKFDLEMEKVIDFGSSCYENQRVYTYIQSRFYRAPEVILGAKYGLPIDMWSLGCILAELLTGYPLLPGEDEADQLACMIELLGMPPPKLLEISRRAKNFISSKGYPRYCEAQTLADGTTILTGGRSRRGKLRGPPGSRDLQTALKCCEDPLFVDFIRRCLEWDPQTRLTPSAAIRHPWLRRRLPRTPADKNESSPSVPASGMTSSTSSSNALRVSSKPNIHNGGGGAVGGHGLDSLGKGCETQVRVSCTTGGTLVNGHTNPNPNGLVTITSLTNGSGSGLNGHTYSHHSVRSHRGSLLDLDGNNSSSTSLNGNNTNSNSTSINGHVHHHGPTVASIVNGVIANGPPTLLAGSGGGSLRVQAHKLPTLHSNINS